ncbi:hypothetical protein AADZ91_02430 [Colwelliaceae bacterium 6441]
MKKIALLITGLTFATISKGDDVNIYCHDLCDTKTTINSYLKYSDNINISNDQVFNLFYQDSIFDSLSFSEFNYRYQNLIQVGNNSFDFLVGDVEPMYDQGIDCRADPFYTCEQWFKSEFLRQIYDVEVSFIVSQEFLDANEKKRAIALTTLTAVPFARATHVLLIAAKTLIPESVIVSLSAGAFAILINEINKKLAPNLKAGDKLSFKGGNVTRTSITDIVKDGDTGDSAGGGGTTGGGGISGGTTGGGGISGGSTGGSTGGTGGSSGGTGGGRSGGYSKCKVTHYYNGNAIFSYMVSC